MLIAPERTPAYVSSGMAKKTLTGEIESSAHKAWHTFARSRHTSVAKLLEVIGENIEAVLGEEDEVLTEATRRHFEGARAGGPKKRKKPT